MQDTVLLNLRVDNTILVTWFPHIEYKANLWTYIFPFWLSQGTSLTVRPPHDQAK